MRKRIAVLLAAWALCLSASAAPRVTLTEAWVRAHYTKREVFVPMRDGVELHTTLYEPSDTLPHPVILLRTPYGLSPYGEDFTGQLRSFMRMFAANRYIIVYQSVRGTYLSGGTYENIRPLKPADAPWEVTDEATDTYDTVEWLLAHARTTGAVGVKGVSYPGFYATLAGLCGHPAVKAVSPQAPVTDWWRGDDVHHNGIWMLDMYPFAASFFRVRQAPSRSGPASLLHVDGPCYDYYLQYPDFPSLTENLGERIPFWDEMLLHPDYDAWWAERNVATRLTDVAPAVLVVGGNYDTDDCYGALETYAALRRQSPRTEACFTYGPWSHGGWRESSYTGLGDSYFGEGSTDWFVEEIEYPFFAWYLEGKGERPQPVHVLPSRALNGAEPYDANRDWIVSDAWPLPGCAERRFYLDGTALVQEAPESAGARSYVSDPRNPVPYMASSSRSRSKNYMAADQRFAARRPDVLTFRGPELPEDLLAAGPVRVHLELTLSTSDADFVVKLIDERPDGYQMLVRGDGFRARYRNSFSDPEPVVPGERFTLDFTLNDIAHIFQAGHRMTVQVQSSWFPVMALSPQFFQDNPYTVPASEFRSCTVRVLNGSWIGVPVLGDIPEN